MVVNCHEQDQNSSCGSAMFLVEGLGMRVEFCSNVSCIIAVHFLSHLIVSNLGMIIFYFY